MPVTLEPRGLNWINNVNTNAFGSLTTQLCWVLGSIAFTALACYLMSRGDYYAAVGALDENGTRQLVMITRETTRNLGSGLATALLVAWGAKTAAGVVDSNNKRQSHPAYAPVLEAKAKGQAAAAVDSAVAAALVTKAANEAITREHPIPAPPAPPAGQTTNVVVGGEVPPVPRPTGDARHDDERGEM